jgi:hypothetical protein
MASASYARPARGSTIRFLAVAWLWWAGAASAAGTSVPAFGSGGFVLALEYGPGFWTMSRDALVAQAPGHAADVDLFLGGLQTSHTLTLRARYSILGHVSVGGDLTATGWNLFDASRGGGGFVAGTVAWHPLMLLFALLKQEPRPVGLDLSTGFGLGYGLVGQARGMDGLVYEWTFTADWFFTRYFALGAFVRGVFLDFSNLYLNFLDRSAAGNTIPLPAHSGGSFWTFGVALEFRAGD